MYDAKPSRSSFLSLQLRHRLGVFLFFLPFGVVLIGITMSSQVLRGVLAFHAIGPAIAIAIACIGFFFWAALFGHNILKWWYDCCFAQRKGWRERRHKTSLLENGPRTVRALYRYGLKSLSDDHPLKSKIIEASWALKKLRQDSKENIKIGILRALQQHWQTFNCQTGKFDTKTQNDSKTPQSAASTWPYLALVGVTFVLALWYQTGWGWLCLACTGLVYWYIKPSAAHALSNSKYDTDTFKSAKDQIHKIYKKDMKDGGLLYRAYFALLLVSHFESLERHLISGQAVKRRQYFLRALGIFNCFVHASATFWGGYQLLTTIMSPATLVALGFYPNLFLMACMFGTGFLAAFALTRIAIYKYYNNEYILPYFTHGCRALKKHAQDDLNKIEMDGKKVFRTPSSFERIMAGRLGLILAWITALGFAVFSYQAGYHALSTMAFMLGLTGPTPMVSMSVGFCWSGSTLLAANAFYGYFRQYPMPNTQTFSWPRRMVFYVLPCVPACATAVMLFMATVGSSSPWLILLHHLGFGAAVSSWMVWGIASIIGAANITLIYKLFLRGMTLLDDFVMAKPTALKLLGLSSADLPDGVPMIDEEEEAVINCEDQTTCRII